MAIYIGAQVHRSAALRQYLRFTKKGHSRVCGTKAKIYVSMLWAGSSCCMALDNLRIRPTSVDLRI